MNEKEIEVTEKLANIATGILLCAFILQVVREARKELKEMDLQY